MCGSELSSTGHPSKAAVKDPASFSALCPTEVFWRRGLTCMLYPLQFLLIASLESAELISLFRGAGSDGHQKEYQLFFSGSLGFKSGIVQSIATAQPQLFQETLPQNV